MSIEIVLVAPMKEGSVINKEDFDRFLSWLCPDRDEAGKKYEDIRRRLIRFFNYRGCAEVEELADETFNRVIKKMPEIADAYIGEPARFIYGVARKIRLERCKPPPPPPPPPAYEPPEEIEKRHKCLDDCLDKLPPAKRKEILDYHSEDKAMKIEHRKRMAEELRIEPNALRIRMCRTRKSLQKCMLKCINGISN